MLRGMAMPWNAYIHVWMYRWMYGLHGYYCIKYEIVVATREMREKDSFACQKSWRAVYFWFGVV